MDYFELKMVEAELFLMNIKREISLMHSQWLIGLEMFLLINDPLRVFFTTDHPNGVTFYILS